MASSSAEGTPLIQAGFDVRFVHHLAQENDLGAFGSFQNNCHPCGFTPRVELDSERLERGFVGCPILQANRERSHLVNNRPSAFEQLPCPCFRVENLSSPMFRGVASSRRTACTTLSLLLTKDQSA
jgi:hypothetical protein